MNPINTSLYQGQYPTSFNWRRLKMIILLVFTSLIFHSCTDKDPVPPTEKTGKIIIHFSHHLNGQPVQFDTLFYINAAGNPYLVNEIQYFISNVTFYNSNGSELIIDEWNDIHYVDTDIPTTHTWEVFDKIPEGTYDSISFVFGIPEEKNNSFMYVNPPESFMFWPEYLGGGYHYLKLNGKWLEQGQQLQTTPFDFHLGRGQIYYSYPDSITGFISNDFNVSLPNSGFQLESAQTVDINIFMNIENWFQGPNIYDHDEWGGYIMQNQDAMQMVKENGWNVFSIEIIK